MFSLMPFALLSGVIPLLFVGFVVLIIVGVIYSARQERQRRAELEAWAAAHHLSLSPHEDPGFKDRYVAFKCLCQGEKGRYAFNKMTGQWNGRDLVAFEYRYQTTSTDSKGHTSTTNHYFSGVLLTAGLPLKPLVLRPEHFFDKIAGFFGFEDINFESAEFSRAFHVASPDRKWAYDVLHPQTMEFLLRQPRYSVQFDAHYVMAWAGSRWKAQEFTAALGVIEGILDGLPPYVIQQQEGVG
ncbi:MAG: hypothetical protein WD042_11845 [Phycisphaeraceae bacterium]